jgi:fibronectin type 3 domain-containing protein
LTVGFAPTTSGSTAGTLIVRSDAQNGTLTVPLAGTAGSHSVTLSWNGPGSQIAGFNVYRSTVSSGPYSRVNGTLVVPTNYSDQTVASGTTYYYTATAVDTNGAESGYSNQTTVAVPTP